MNKDFTRVQHQIRQNASSLQDALREMGDWEAKVKKKDAAIKARKGTKALPPVRGSGGRVVSASSGRGGAAQPHPFLRDNDPEDAAGDDDEEGAAKPPASHVYDKGYKKWENFDVDAALEEVDQDKKATPKPKKKRRPKASAVGSPLEVAAAQSYESPAARARALRVAREAEEKQAAATPGKKGQTAAAKRAARPAPVAAPAVSREELERIDGNKLYKKGDFNGAIKCYTRCIGLNPENHVAYSNRAMAYLKAKNFSKAEEDCCSAVRLCPGHVKSWNRRGTARNKLGRHRAAMRDFEQVLRLEPRNKQATNDLRKTREAVKQAAKRAPRKTAPNIRQTGGHAIPWVAKPTEESGARAPSVGATAVVAAKAAPAPPAANNTEVAEKAQAVVRERARKLALESPPPGTMFEFSKTWNSLKNDSEGKALYVSKIPRKVMKKVFKGEMEAELFMELLRLGRSYWDGVLSPRVVLSMLDSFSQTGGCLKMVFMFLNDEDKKFATDIARDTLDSFKGDDGVKKSVARVKKGFSL